MPVYRLIQNLSVGVKLFIAVLGGLGLLAGLSWFALDRLGFVASLQAGAVAQAAIGHQVQDGLFAAQELRVISRQLQGQQTASGIRAALDRATKQTEAATGLIRAIAGQSDPALASAASQRIEALMDAVKRAADLRADMLTVRQKRLFQVRATFETSLATLTDEIARGSALATGVESVRTEAQTVQANQRDPNIDAIVRYRLAIGRIQQAALMFMATGNPSAANEVRDATAEQAAAMAVVLSSDLPDAVKADARIVDAIGKGIAGVSSDLIAMDRKLDTLTGTEVEAASEALRTSFSALRQKAAEQERVAVDLARSAAADANRDILVALGVIALLMVLFGLMITHMIAWPIQAMTRVVQAIAGGETDRSVPFASRRDEIGRMAASVETLRGVMKETFVQSQMIEQLPIGVMTAEHTGDFRVTYLNAEARQILNTVKDHLAAPVERLVGQSIDVFHRNPDSQRRLIADPANLPHVARITLGGETLELRVSAIMDRGGAYAGPLLIWRRMTGQVRLVDQFEKSIGAIARTVAEAADGMQQAASVMRQSTIDAGHRTSAVSSASEQASRNVSTAAAGAEEVAVSVAEIGRQVAESARVAANGVAEAKATDASISGLDEAAERISKVINLIGEIAARTNLLALNATIEAARAGEAGKGFAVVASEVKNLATQTAKATEEIGGQITAMQNATTQAVVALRSIGATIARMDEITGIIATSVDQQGEATQSIAQAVQHAAAGTAEVNGNIAAVTEVVEEAGGKAGGLLEAATKMSEQAAMLKQEVASFLLAVQQAA